MDAGAGHLGHLLLAHPHWHHAVGATSRAGAWLRGQHPLRGAVGEWGASGGQEGVEWGAAPWHSVEPSCPLCLQLAWTGFAPAERFDDSDFWKVSGCLGEGGRSLCPALISPLLPQDPAAEEEADGEPGTRDVEPLAPDPASLGGRWGLQGPSWGSPVLGVMPGAGGGSRWHVVTAPLTLAA